jgi:hypothetical protein
MYGNLRVATAHFDNCLRASKHMFLPIALTSCERSCSHAKFTCTTQQLKCPKERRKQQRKHEGRKRKSIWMRQGLEDSMLEVEALRHLFSGGTDREDEYTQPSNMEDYVDSEKKDEQGAVHTATETKRYESNLALPQHPVSQKKVFDPPDLIRPKLIVHMRLLRWLVRSNYTNTCFEGFSYSACYSGIISPSRAAKKL